MVHTVLQARTAPLLEGYPYSTVRTVVLLGSALLWVGPQTCHASAYMQVGLQRQLNIVCGLMVYSVV